MMYVVGYYEDYVGYILTRNSKVFSDKAKAEQYAHNLNENLAKVWSCEIENLRNYYEVQEAPLA